MGLARGDMTKYYDLAILWGDEKPSLRSVNKTGGIWAYGYPEYLRPNGWVALVDKDNQVLMMFRTSRVDGPYEFELETGKTRRRYFIKADKRTMKQPKGIILGSVRGWAASGTYRYFDKSTMKAVIVDDVSRFANKHPANATKKVRGTVFQIHAKGVPGMPRGHPESDLVDQYVHWLGDETRFGHNFIREEQLFVDLFDLTHWQLIEAKVKTDRETIRMAIGQLMDYKRFYSRIPSLAVLLASRPSAHCMKLLTDNRIAVIWKNPGGSFSTKRWQAEKN